MISGSEFSKIMKIVVKLFVYAERHD